jgi:spermidine/putrescine transport system substrate-binding protein
MGLGMYYEEELLELKEQYKQGLLTKSEYKSTLSQYMNDTSKETMAKVKKGLEKMRKNLYGLETDEAKLEVISGRLDAAFQWSGDAVYIIDEAEENDLELEYSIPESASNLWFDGWVMMKDANEHAATAFVNFLSMPQNVVRNMYYIGYTSCIAGEEVFNYVSETYSDEDGTETYDLSYFFGENHKITTTIDQTRRQLFAQYPTAETIDRLVVMEYFDAKTNERANRMWNNIK